jgi:hypothetical protein
MLKKVLCAIVSISLFFLIVSCPSPDKDDDVEASPTPFASLTPSTSDSPTPSPFDSPSPSPEGCLIQEMEEYGYEIYFICIVLADFGESGSKIISTGANEETIIFTNMKYGDETETVSGTIVYGTDPDFFTEVGTLTFADDSEGLETIQTDMVYDNEQYTGTFTINGCNDSSAEAYQEYMES